MTTHHVRMDWTAEKAIHVIHLFDQHKLSYLRKLTDFELFDLGKQVGAWHGKNPFKPKFIQEKILEEGK